MKKTHLNHPASCEKFQEDAFVMDVAWLQRDSFHTLELSVQDTDFLSKNRCLFSKLGKQPKKTRVTFGESYYSYSIQKVFFVVEI